jgi:hypothetical protein
MSGVFQNFDPPPPHCMGVRGEDLRAHRVATTAFWRTFQAGEGGGCTTAPFITFTITSKVAVYAPAEWADTLTLFHLQ